MRAVGTIPAALDVSVLAARLLSMNTIAPELQALASATLSRSQHARTACGRLLTAMIAALPPATPTRENEELLGELHTLPARRSRGRLVARTLSGLPGLAVILRMRALCNRRTRW